MQSNRARSSYFLRFFSAFLFFISAGPSGAHGDLLEGHLGRQPDEPALRLQPGPQLLVDTHLLSDWWNVRRVQGRVRKYPGNPVLKPEHQWERRTYGGFADSAVYDAVDKKFKLWHHVEQFPDPRKKMSGSNVMGYAESVDGFHWVKPPLRLHQYEGTLDNNICRLADTGGYVWGGIAVVQDPRPASARGGRRFEAIGLSPFHADGQRINGWKSPAYSHDGLTWHLLPGGVRKGAGGGNASCLWDESLGKYVLYTRKVLEAAGAGSGRFVCRQTSTNLSDWSPRQTVLNSAMDSEWPEIENMFVFRHGGIYFGLPQMLENEKRREVQVQLAISRDGIRWERPFPREAFIPRGYPDEFDSINTWFAQPVVRPDGVFFFYAGQRHHHGSRAQGPETGLDIGVATLPRDRIIGLRADQRMGAILTRPFVVEGDDLYVNASLEDQGQKPAREGVLSVEVVPAYEDYVIRADKGEAHGYQVAPSRRAFAGFEMTACDAVTGDSFDHPIKWQGKSLGEFRDQVVRLRIHFKVGTVWAFTVR